MSTRPTSVEPSTVSELIEQAKHNPLKWIVPDGVLEDGVHVLHGAEESFKTMLTLQLHEALTLGGSFSCVTWKADSPPGSSNSK